MHHGPNFGNNKYVRHIYSFKSDIGKINKAEFNREGYIYKIKLLLTVNIDINKLLKSLNEKCMKFTKELFISTNHLLLYVYSSKKNLSFSQRKIQIPLDR